MLISWIFHIFTKKKQITPKPSHKFKNGGNEFPTNVKVMKLSELTPSLGFTEFNYVKEHLLSFEKSELGLMKAQIPFTELLKSFKPKKRKNSAGRREIFHRQAQIGLMFLKAKYNLSDKSLIERLNTDISFQFFCDTFIPAASPLVDSKIVSRIRTNLAKELDLDEFQKVIANSLKSHISTADLQTVMSDATCYESHLRFPTDQKLLWESIEHMYKIIKSCCSDLAIRIPRTKYRAISSAYLSFAKTRKKSHKKRVKITRRLLQLLEKLLSEFLNISTSHNITLKSSVIDYYNTIKEILIQQQDHFQGKEVRNRIVSISKPYIRPIVRGKEGKSVEFGAKVNAIQVGGFNFIEHLNFNAFHEGIRLPACLLLHKELFNTTPLFFAGDAIYANNANRSFCKTAKVTTNFIPKGKRPKDDKADRVIRKGLNIARSTVLEGSFGTEKEHYSLRKIKARTKQNEILWILFGIHTANFSRLAYRLFNPPKEVSKAA